MFVAMKFDDRLIHVLVDITEPVAIFVEQEGGTK